MGQEGVVTAVLRKQNRIIIEGVNMVSILTVDPLSSIPIQNHMCRTLFLLSHEFSHHPEKENCEKER